MQSNRHLDSYKIVENTLSQLPSHKQMHDELLTFSELVGWLNRSGCTLRVDSQTRSYFNDLRAIYIETGRQLYLREITPFCLCARAKILKNDSRNRNGTHFPSLTLKCKICIFLIHAAKQLPARWTT